MTLSSLSLLNLNNNNNAFSDSHQSPCSSVQYIHNRNGTYTWWKHQIHLAYNSGAAAFLCICWGWFPWWHGQGRAVFCCCGHPWKYCWLLWCEVAMTSVIAVSCPPTKQIWIFINLTTHERKKEFQEETLRNNFSYTVSHNMYGPQFPVRENIQQDEQIKYNFTNLGQISSGIL